MRRFRAVLLILLAAALAGLIAQFTCSNPDPNAEPVRITIPPGTTFGAVTDSLVARRIVTHPTWFKLMARVRGLDRSVQAGAYSPIRPDRRDPVHCPGRALTF
jgi:cell division protein YceG involved in septum cleavage